MRRTLLATLVVATACSAGPAEPVGNPTNSAMLTPSATEMASAATPGAGNSSTPRPSESLVPTARATPPGSGFDGARALALATELAGMGHRDAGTPGDVRARAWLTQLWEAEGWIVTEETVTLPQGGTSANVLAVRDPADLDGPHVVIGAHHDTRNQSPGANDNASGVAVLVEAARHLAAELPVPVVLVGFGAEEFQPAEPRLHHLGSHGYAVRRRDDVRAAFIVDMVGVGPTTCICWFDEGPRTLADRLRVVADDTGLSDFQVERRGDISDHGPFARLGLPAAFLWTYEDGRYHTAADTAEHLQAPALQRAGDLVLAFVDSLTDADASALRAQP